VVARLPRENKEADDTDEAKDFHDRRNVSKKD